MQIINYLHTVWWCCEGAQLIQSWIVGCCRIASQLGDGLQLKWWVWIIGCCRLFSGMDSKQKWKE